MPLEKISIERKWSAILGGLRYGRQSYDSFEHLFQLSPEYSEREVADIDRGSALSLGPLLPAMLAFDYGNVTRFGCPVVLFLGRHDDTTPSEIAAASLAQVHAPDKRLVWFENSADMAMVEEPGRFLVHLVREARPYSGVKPEGSGP